MRRHRTTLTVLLTLMALPFAAGAHDFWLVPDAFVLAPTQDLVVRGQTSSAFPTSESAVTADRVTSARVIGADGEETITALAADARSLLLRHRPRTPGQKIVAVAVNWRHVKETADSFRQYLVAEGAEAALRRYEQAGVLPAAPIVRRYAKYAKTVVEFGNGPRAFATIAGHPLEFVPMGDPSSARPGGTLRWRLQFNGAPLAAARLHAGLAAVKGGAPTEVDLVTGEDGTVAVPITAAGLWNVRTIHVMPAPKGADADWEVHWATFVFRVAGATR